MKSKKHLLLQLKDVMYTTEKLTDLSEHGQRLKMDYDLVVNENAFETQSSGLYYTYLGAAYGPDIEEVRYN